MPNQPLQYSCLENPKEKTLKDKLSRLVGTQYATGYQWRYNSRKNEETEPKQKQYPVVDATVMKVKSDAIKINIA